MVRYYHSVIKDTGFSTGKAWVQVSNLSLFLLFLFLFLWCVAYPLKFSLSPPTMSGMRAAPDLQWPWGSHKETVRTYNTGFVERVLFPKLGGFSTCEGIPLGYSFWLLSALLWTGKVTESDRGVWRCFPAPPSPLSFLLGDGQSSKIACCALVLPYVFNIMEMFAMEEIFSTFPFRESPWFSSTIYDSTDKCD